jgi:hypothetical protein
MSELQKITMTEYGITSVHWDGTLRFEARGARGQSGLVQHTIEDAISMTPERSIEQKKNRILVKTHPATAGASSTTTLYLLDVGGTPPDPAVEIRNGPNAEMFFAFQDPNSPSVQIGATEVAIPTPTTDYTLNANAAGTGSDLTAHGAITLDWRVASNGVYLTVTNGYGQAIYLTFLQLLGRPIFTYNEVTSQEDDDDSIADHGLQALALDMPYQADAGVGTALAQYLLETYRNVETRIKAVTFKAVESAAHVDAMIHGAISDRVHINEDVSGVDADFFLQGRRIEWRGPVADTGGADTDDIDVVWHVAPIGAGGAGAGDFWELGVDSLDETTVLGF